MWWVGGRKRENDVKELKGHTEKKKPKTKHCGNYHEGNVPNCQFQR